MCLLFHAMISVIRGEGDAGEGKVSQSPRWANLRYRQQAVHLSEAAESGRGCGVPPSG
jgi:hypothetical protein